MKRRYNNLINVKNDAVGEGSMSSEQETWGRSGTEEGVVAGK